MAHVSIPAVAGTAHMPGPVQLMDVSCTKHHRSDGEPTDRYRTKTQCRREADNMAVLELAIAFFVLALIAGIFGARGIAGLSMGIAKWLVIIFVILAVVSMLL